ncbi:MAG TPA: haloalkane dehalogenase [Marmoricola sp.]
MAFREVGHGVPAIFLHGNPTSSYLWRHVVDEVAPVARCLAVDLIGMGASDKLPGTGDGRYRLMRHRRFLDAFLEPLRAAGPVVLVGHDWGGVLAMDWAHRHPADVRGIAYLETHVAPVTSADPSAPAPEIFGPLRSSAGEELVLQDNVLIEQVLPAGIMRPLSDAETAAYRAPFRDPGEGRRPMLTWAREIPLDGNPADVTALVSANSTWMAHSEVPKLFINGDPGAVLTGRFRDLCRTWPRQDEVTVHGSHFLPEDSPLQIGRALADWIASLP